MQPTRLSEFLVQLPVPDKKETGKSEEVPTDKEFDNLNIEFPWLECLDEKQGFGGHTGDDSAAGDDDGATPAASAVDECDAMAALMGRLDKSRMASAAGPAASTNDCRTCVMARAAHASAGATQHT